MPSAFVFRAFQALLLCIPWAGGWAFAAQGGPVKPFETSGGQGWSHPVDHHALSSLQQRGIKPAALCSDEVFVRRVFLDLIGTLPGPQEVRSFLEDRSPDKRALLIDSVLARQEFAEYWSMKWCDLLRVKSEFPINLWPNAVQAYHRWILQALRTNKPYDRFARELLTSSGSNFRAGPVNFYRAVQSSEPSALADAVALTFMGTRLEHWPADQRADMAAFFSRVAYKPTAEWKEEIVLLDPSPAEPIHAVLPDGKKVTILPDQDPRVVFADWLLQPDNPWFARNMANRLWAWLMGRGIVHECDDIRPDNPPVNPELLAFLEKELVKSGYDLQFMYRLICTSRTYQQSSIPTDTHPDAAALFACYPVRRLEAEVLIDALCALFGGAEGYTSPIPEPFTYIPARQRTIMLADGSISSPFLEMFGRPARDTGLEAERNNRTTDAQRLHMLNSTHIQRQIESSPRVRQWITANRRDVPGLVRQVYMAVLSRQPTAAEQGAALEYFKAAGSRMDGAVHDLTWALINSKEFLYRH